MTAATILTNACVLTMDPDRPTAQAIALGGGRVLALGERTVVEALAGPATDIIDCGGASVLPGFVESHMHLGPGGSELAHLQVGAIDDAAGLARAVRAFATAHPDRPLADDPKGRATRWTVVPSRGRCWTVSWPTGPLH